MTFDPNDSQYQPYSSSEGAKGAVHPQAQPLKILGFALMSGLVVITVAMAFVLEPYDFQTLPAALGVIAGLVAAVIVQAVIKPQPFPGGSQPEAGAVLDRFRMLMIPRFAIAEMPAILTLVLCFVFQANVLSLLPAVLISLALMAFRVMPSRPNLATIERVFDREGAQSRLSALFGH